jgi:hypothetical protein
MAAVLRVPGFLRAVTLLAAVSLTGCGGGGSGDTSGSSAEKGADASEAARRPDDFGCLTSAEAEAASITFKSADSTETGGYMPGGASGAGPPVRRHRLPVEGQGRRAAPGRLSGARGQFGGSGGLRDRRGGRVYLRGKGAKKLLLMGASKGGTAVLTAAPELQPQRDAVVSLSAPTLYSGMNALGAVPKLTAPVLYMAAEYDEYFGDDAKTLNRASTKAAEHKLIYVKGAGEHGVALLDSQENRATVRAFLKKYGS